MAAMFKALESTGLRGFLGCPSGVYEADLVAFFQNALVRENSVVSTIQGKSVEITEGQFSGIFELPTEGLSDLSEVPKELIFDARSIFSNSGEQVQTRKMKYEFRFLNDILAKYVTVKAGYFDAVTHERFLLMTAIHCGLKINWSKLLFDILKEMVTPSSKQDRGFAVQICVLLQEIPDLALCEPKPFPSLKFVNCFAAGSRLQLLRLVALCLDSLRLVFLRLDEQVKICLQLVVQSLVVKCLRLDFPTTDPSVLNVKNVGTYVAKQKSIDDSHEEDEPLSKNTAVKKVVSKKRPAAPDLVSPSSYSDSSIHFTTDDIPLGNEPTAILSPDLTAEFAQLRASVDQISLDRLQTKIQIERLKAEFFAKISILETSLLTRADNQDRAARVQTEIFRKEGAVMTKGEVGSSQGQGSQPPPDDRNRPGGGGGSRSEPVKKRGSGSYSGPRQRGFRYFLGGE
ncbi:hypothetical protein F511_37388 [Dorcoceras hygrometricum]|uniref:Dystroglycan-like n=1 Tax=Dorcoceras hygrometricum TaxID=472368 RepID=A0A2Z7B964_9LAMI|nr:hypothetical protein F511_37388 [Dorcoceras hygrometricum]